MTLIMPGRQVGSLSRQLEDEKGKTAQLKRDMDNFKRKAKAEQEKAARMVRKKMPPSKYMYPMHSLIHACTHM